MDDALRAQLAGLRERFGVAEADESFGEVSVDVRREDILVVAAALKDDGPFEMLADWSATDFLDRYGSDRRFLLSAHLTSVRHPRRLRVRVWVPEADQTCPTLTTLWPGANFQEREIFDFFGVTFDGHPNMRRIFMPDEWDGHPQRKDYPLGGSNVFFEHGAFIPPPDLRVQPTTTSGYPGRIS